jgi:hypothetical protein
VVLGGIGLAELLQPGILDQLLALDMDDGGIRIAKQGAEIELSWPLMGWRLRESSDLNSWTDRPDFPNPYLFNASQSNVFFRIVR